MLFKLNKSKTDMSESMSIFLSVSYTNGKYTFCFIIAIFPTDP